MRTQVRAQAPVPDPPVPRTHHAVRGWGFPPMVLRASLSARSVPGPDPGLCRAERAGRVTVWAPIALALVSRLGSWLTGTRCSSESAPTPVANGSPHASPCPPSKPHAPRQAPIPTFCRPAPRMAGMATARTLDEGGSLRLVVTANRSRCARSVAVSEEVHSGPAACWGPESSWAPRFMPAGAGPARSRRGCSRLSASWVDRPAVRSCGGRGAWNADGPCRQRTRPGQVR